MGPFVQKHYPNPPPASKNVWFIDEESRLWREGVISECVCIDRTSNFSTWTFFITVADGETVRVTSTSLSHDSFDFKDVKERENCGCPTEFDGLLFPNEPEILRFLTTNYSEKIYYHCISDSVTVAMNPNEKTPLDFEEMVSGSSFFNVDNKRTQSSRSSTHAFTTADAAFSSMCADKYNLDNRVDQTIFVWGSSGSGKSENVRQMLHYLLYLSVRVLGDVLGECDQLGRGDSPRLAALRSIGASPQPLSFDSSLEGRFAAVTAVLDSLGSACRPGSCSSSRMGRILELSYSAHCCIEDASVEAFLLESERVHSYQHRERNFHIFYELLAGASAELRKECGLDSLDAADFFFTSQGGVIKRTDQVSDEAQFIKLCQSLDILGVSASDQEEFLKCVAGVLHLGNVNFELRDGGVVLREGGQSGVHVDSACRLFCSTKSGLLAALGRSSSSSVEALSCVEAAESARNHLARTMYQLLVEWVLKKSKGLRHSDHAADSTPLSLACTSSITIVDCFGMENSQCNSFMQFCGNYVSEKMQNYFVSSVLGSEQERYAHEGIDWKFIPFFSNNEVMKMYEAERGLFALLEEEAHAPHPSDTRLMQQCHHKVRGYGCLMSTQRDHKGLKFTIQHHSGAATYDSHGFTEQNRAGNAATSGQLSFLEGSSSSFVATLAGDLLKEHKHNYRHKFFSSSRLAKTTTTHLQKQLNRLMHRASSTRKHWMICMKPSASGKASEVESDVLLAQIVDKNLVPLVALSQRGYPHEMSFHDFVSTFCDLVLLAGKCAITSDFLAARQERDWEAAAIFLLGFIRITEEVLDQMGADETSAGSDSGSGEVNVEDSVIFVKRSVFIKRAMFEHLQLLSSRIRIIMIVRVQRHFRVRLMSSQHRALAMTSSCLAFFANMKFRKVLEETNARVVLQRYVRAFLAGQKKRRRARLVVRVQALVRGFFVRRGLRERSHYACRMVQLRWMRLVYHRRFLRRLEAARRVQRAVRRWLMVKRLRVQERIVRRIQRQWRSKRPGKRELRRQETVAVDDEETLRKVKEDFLAALDVRLSADPLYLVTLLKREEEVGRLAQRVEDMKKLAVSRSHDLAASSFRLQQGVGELNALREALEASRRKEERSAERDAKGLLKSVAQLQEWVAEKELTRVKAIGELAGADAKMTAMIFDAALHKKKTADMETTLVTKTREFKEFEFSLVKTSQNAKQVEYDVQALKAELKTLQDQHDQLHAVASREVKQHESLKAFCSVLKNRIAANSPEIQMAELQFGLQALQSGEKGVFSKVISRERLQVEENGTYLSKAQKRMTRPSDVSSCSGGGSNGGNKRISTRSSTSSVSSDASGISGGMSYRHFQVHGAAHPTSISSADDEHLLPKYTSFRQAGRTVASAVKAQRKSKVKNLAPPPDANGHKWKSKFLSHPTWCMICNQFIKGLTTNQQHAFKCRNCKIIGHRNCCQDLECQCGTLSFNNDDDILVPANSNDHLWAPKQARVEDKCELCEKYMSDTVPGKSPFTCRRCKVFGHRDCCALFSLEPCGSHKPAAKKAHPLSPLHINLDVADSIGATISQCTGQLGALMDSIASTALEINGHKFKTKFLSKPTWCGFCKQFIVGLTARQQSAVKCSVCKESCHRHCAIEFNEGDEAKRRVCPQKPIK